MCPSKKCKEYLVYLGYTICVLERTWSLHVKLAGASRRKRRYDGREDKLSFRARIHKKNSDTRERSSTRDALPTKSGRATSFPRTGTVLSSTLLPAGNRSARRSGTARRSARKNHYPGTRSRRSVTSGGPHRRSLIKIVSRTSEQSHTWSREP